MRCSTCVIAALLMTTFVFGENSNAQDILDKKITVEFQGETLKVVLDRIAQTAGLSFNFTGNNIPLETKVTLIAEEKPVKEVLNAVLSSRSLSYMLFKDRVIIWNNSNRNGQYRRLQNSSGQVLSGLPFLNTTASLMQVTVSGKVTDKGGEGIPGVNITVKNTTLSTSTDRMGNYVLNNVAQNATLIFSFTGYKSKEVAVSNQKVINVVLEQNVAGLDEIVVIGYGGVKKVDLTGSVGQVDMHDLIKAPVGSFADALAGRIAGVQVSANDGQPGGPINIMIRGAGSLTQSTTPLYVVDGFPIESLDPSTINTEDIESITVLKDASSAAIYGSRAANGVILIQTKRGVVGEPVVNVSASMGFQSDPKQIELMNPYEFVKYQSEIYPTHPSTLPYFAGGKTLEDYRDVKGINWQDLVFRPGAVKIYNLALRGGNNHTRYSVSGSVYDQKGVVINTGYSRYSGRVTLDQTISNKIKAGITANYSSVESFGQIINEGAGSTSPRSTAMIRTWIYRPIQYEGNENDLIDEPVDDDAVTSADFRVNPFIDLDNQHQLNKTNVLDGNAYVSYDIIKGLTLKTTAGIRQNGVHRDRFFNSKTAQGSPSNVNNTNGVNGSIQNIVSNSYSSESSLTYKKSFNKSHNLSLLGLFSINGANTKIDGYSGRLLPNENLGMDGLDEGISYNPLSSTSKSTMVSYAARADYNYKSKYLATVTFRADGSSKFVNPWGYFPGAALGWNMDREDFFRNALPFISTSKIRASYGSTGNNRVGDFDTYPRLKQSLDGYSFNNSVPIGGVYVSAVGNPELRWEKVNTIDLGYELGVLNNKIAVEVDLYKRTTENMLLQANLPLSTGFSSARKNIGKLRNDGLEITLKTVNIEKRNFSWTSSFNISFNKNQILELADGQQGLPANGQYESQYDRPLYLAEIGEPAGMIVGFVWEGNYQYADFNNPSPGVYLLKKEITTNGAIRNSIQPGDIKYKDMNGDGIINDYDLTIIGRGQPIHIGGFSNNFNYRGLSLNVFFQWSYGNDIYNANRLAMEGNSNRRANINQFASYVNRWSPDNPTNANFRAGGEGPIGFYSSRVLEDGSYLRLKTVSLDYSVPVRYIKKAFLSNLTISVAAQNLLTMTKYTGMDPEVSILNPVLSPGFDFSSYPQARTITFGLKAAF